MKNRRDIEMVIKESANGKFDVKNKLTQGSKVSFYGINGGYDFNDVKTAQLFAKTITKTNKEFPIIYFKELDNG